MRPLTLKVARLVSIVATVFIALACGTNYAYSTWSPQFAHQLKLTSTESNLIGSFGNLGMYIPAILVGIVVDSQGPRLGVGLGAALLGIGYFALYIAFKSESGSFPIAALCFFSFLTGCGSCWAFLAALKTAAVNYPDSRGTATGLPLAGYGLSAFIFSTISSLAFSDDTQLFLLMLAIVTFAFNATSFFFVRLLPPCSTPPPHASNRPDSQSLQTAFSDDGRSQQMSGEPAKAQELRASVEAFSSQGEYHSSMEETDTHETSSLLSKCSTSGSDEYQFVAEVQKDSQPRNVDIRGLALLAEPLFWQLFFMFGLLSGIGLMNINNLGNDVQALWRHYDGSMSPTFIANQQSMHVSILSVSSCVGRLLSGAGSDLLVKKLNMNRMWCLLTSALTFTAAQISALQIEDPHYLAAVSGLTGLAYGILYGFFPSLLAHKFGVTGMSQNWGTIILAPVISGNFFNLLYGKVYDSHTVVLPSGERECRDGLSCYRAALWVTLFAGLLGTALSLRSLLREHRLMRKILRTERRSDHNRDA